VTTNEKKRETNEKKGKGREREMQIIGESELGKRNER